MHEAMIGNEVLAVVVTYQPDERLEGNLQALREQIKCVVVVDNGSANISAVELITSKLGCRLIKNGSNLGIAHALNQGAAIAMAEGFSWLATFDQDSLVTPGMVQGMLALHQVHPMKDKIGVLVAFHRDEATGINYDDPRDILFDSGNWTLLRTTITSGSLISDAALRVAGPFDDSLFIDFVDHDFYLRCRKRGFLIVGVKHHVLIHSLGKITLHGLLDKVVPCSNHSALRRYYISRNQLEVYRRYCGYEPRWCLRGIWQLIVNSGLMLTFEQDRFVKIRATFKGASDFMLRRFGRLDGWP